MNHNMLWLHSEARSGRPSSAVMNRIRANYKKGARFRVHQDVVRLAVGVRTIFKPVIEVLVYLKGRWTWVTYLWLDHEEVGDAESYMDQPVTERERAAVARKHQQ